MSRNQAGQGPSTLISSSVCGQVFKRWRNDKRPCGHIRTQEHKHDDDLCKDNGQNEERTAGKDEILMRIKEIKVAKTQFDEIRKGEDELPLLYRKEQCMSYKEGDILKIYSMNKELKKDVLYWNDDNDKNNSLTFLCNLSKEDELNYDKSLRLALQLTRKGLISEYKATHKEKKIIL